MHRMLPATLTCALLALSAPVAAAPPTEAERPGRFIMQPVDGGVIRMDSETGALSMCVKRQAAFVCEPVEDKAAASADVLRLGKENNELRAEIRRLEDMLGLGDKPATEKPVHRHPKFELPTEEDVDKAMTYVEKMIKKFREKLKDIEGSAGKGTQL